MSPDMENFQITEQDLRQFREWEARNGKFDPIHNKRKTILYQPPENTRNNKVL